MCSLSTVEICRSFDRKLKNSGIEVTKSKATQSGSSSGTPSAAPKPTRTEETKIRCPCGSHIDAGIMIQVFPNYDKIYFLQSLLDIRYTSDHRCSRIKDLICSILMYQCDDPKCRVWQHMNCVVHPEKPTDGAQPEIPPNHFCELCRINKGDP